MNVTTEKIAKHTGLPENLIDDACEMKYNYKHSTSSNIFGHSNRMEEKELQEYEDILKHYRDLRNSLYTAEEKVMPRDIQRVLPRGVLRELTKVLC